MYGQGISSDFIYTGDYDDSPFFGYLSYNEVLQLVSRLPQYPYYASEQDLCPPTIMVLDESGNGLSISATTEYGRYDLYYVGDKSGDVATNVSIEEVAEILGAYYSGSSLNVESYEERYLRSYRERYEVLAYIPGIEEIIEDDIIWSSRIKHVSISFERDKYSNEVYARVNTSRGEIKLPLHRIMEVKFVRGGFWTYPHVELKFINERGRVEEHIMRLNKKDRERIEYFASNVARILPDRVKVK